MTTVVTYLVYGIIVAAVVRSIFIIVVGALHERNNSE